jgi:signal transduction histidine kinase/ActR/RegA family two-component response regulator
MNRLRVLSLIQNEQDYDLLRSALAQEGIDGDLVDVRTRGEFEAALANQSPELILAGFNVPDCDAMTALHLARERLPEVPFLFLTGTPEEERAVEPARNDVTDYVPKQHLERLAPAVRRAVQGRAARTEDTRRGDPGDQFLVVLSHEFRNPLAPIRNAVEIMRLYGIRDPVLREVRDVIERQLLRLTQMVNDLLDIHCITHGRMLLRKGLVDVARLVGQTATEHAPVFEKRGLRLTVEVPEEPLQALGDPTRLQQVVNNLLHNALKFTNRGGRIEVRVWHEDLPPRVAVSVSDNGTGIEPDLLPRVFDSFSRADLQSGREGLGLGLALVKGLVRLQGGDVEAGSAGPGQGARFTFWLPLIAPLPENSRALPRLAPAKRSLKILIAEDNIDTAKSLSMLLTHYGHQVTTVHTGSAAVRAARREHPDVVLCDLGLPEMDGFGVARTLRREPSARSPWLIAISGYGQEEDQRHSQESGFDLHLTKPVDPAELQRLLDSLNRPYVPSQALPQEPRLQRLDHSQSAAPGARAHIPTEGRGPTPV